MPSPKATIWQEAPKLALPDVPAILCDSSNLWLAYLIASSLPNRYAVVRFMDVIDHRLSPINDEGIGKHPYAKAGLNWYSFNEIIDSSETIRWSVLKAGLIARHWVITFKDNTLDVIARGAEIVTADRQASSPVAALLGLLDGDAA
ncbi:MAG: hypothetical protein HYY23_04400 [Verrucomicrobia bacterium]|nr:hypothetical protein [Verrucomicrobiota bacterium]